MSNVYIPVATTGQPYLILTQAGSPTHAGFAAFSQQPSAAAQQTDSEPTAAELEAVAIDELNDFMDPASFLDMVDCVPGSNWCTEGSIFQDI